MELASILVNTSDDWCPNINEHFATLFLFENKGQEKSYRVAVWGDDDLGMDLDLKSSVEAVSVYRSIKNLPDVTMEILSSMGFTSA